jgi:hypothetical protein
MDYVRWMVALGIESGRERKHVGGAKLHAEATGFAALDDDRNTSFSHGISTLGDGSELPEILEMIIACGGAAECDTSHGRR